MNFQRNAMTSHSPSTSITQARVEQLWLLHYASVVETAQRILHRKDLAEETAQQVFVVYLERSCSPAPGKERAFLRRMAFNLAITYLRRQTLEERHCSATQPPSPSAEDEASLRDQSDRIIRSISKLPNQQQSVIVRRHIAGLSGQETATDLGVSPGTVKSQGSRARAALRVQLQDVA